MKVITKTKDLMAVGENRVNTASITQADRLMFLQATDIALIVGSCIDGIKPPQYVSHVRHNHMVAYFVTHKVCEWSFHHA